MQRRTRCASPLPGVILSAARRGGQARIHRCVQLGAPRRAAERAFPAQAAARPAPHDAPVAVATFPYARCPLRAARCALPPPPPACRPPGRGLLAGASYAGSGRKARAARTAGVLGGESAPRRIQCARRPPRTAARGRRGPQPRGPSPFDSTSEERVSAVAAANSSLLPDSEFVLPKLVVNAFFRGKLGTRGNFTEAF